MGTKLKMETQRRNGFRSVKLPSASLTRTMTETETDTDRPAQCMDPGPLRLWAIRGRAGCGARPYRWMTRNSFNANLTLLILKADLRMRSDWLPPAMHGSLTLIVLAASMQCAQQSTNSGFITLHATVLLPPLLRPPATALPWP